MNTDDTAPATSGTTNTEQDDGYISTGSAAATSAAQADAAWKLRVAIRQAARDGFGAQIVETPVEGYQVLTTTAIDDALAGVRAAVLAHDVALGQLLVYTEEARAAGRSWDEVAEALGIPVRSGESRGELAFLLVVEGRPLPIEERSWWDRATAWWECTACGRRISDSGPFESHPDDNETGHAPTCSRRAAAIAAHQRNLDDEDGAW